MIMLLYIIVTVIRYWISLREAEKYKAGLPVVTQHQVHSLQDWVKYGHIPITTPYPISVVTINMEL
jgi:hypothetical protein